MRAGFKRIVLVVMFATAAPRAQADPFVEHTERVLREDAELTRTNRIVGGIVLLGLGGLALGGGYALAQTPDEGGFVDLSPIARGFGYALMVGGGLNVIAGTILFFTRLQPERRYDGLRAQIARGDGRRASIRVRDGIAADARGERRTRRIMRPVGLGLTVAGLAAGACGLAIRNSSEQEHWLYLGGVTGVTLGVGLMIGGAVDGPSTRLERELSRGPRPAFVPTTGGAMLSLGGTF